MRALAKFTFAALTAAALGAAAVHAIHAQAISPAVIMQQSVVTAAPDTKVYADWQGAFTQPFGARVPRPRCPRRRNRRPRAQPRPQPAVFGGMEKMQVLHEAPEDKGL